MALIEIRKLSKCYGSGENKLYALNEVDLSIEKGDFVSIIGQSGSGKSTLMNILGCLDTPTSGSYKIHGVEAGRMKSEDLARLRSKTFGFIFQRYNLLTNLSALDNVALPAIYRGIDMHTRMKRAKNLLSELELPDKLENRPNELSGGQQQRVSIARALMNGGEIILADEPTGALDSKSGEMVMDIIINLHKRGHTIILVTHDKNIANYANRIIEIKDGKIIEDCRKNDEIISTHEKAPELQKSKFAYIRDMLTESFKMSVQAILTHKMRSLLTMLGIIIGIASVVSVVALGRGSQEKIMENINAMGTNTMDILPGKDFGDMRSGRIKTLTVDDSLVLSQQSYIDSASPNVSSGGTLVYKNISVTAQLSGVGEQFFDVKGYTIEAGRSLTDNDIKHNASVVIIDQNVKKKLFSDGTNPLGEIIIFNKKPLQIIGIVQRANMPGNQSENLNMWSPYTTVMNKISGAKNINSITAKVSDSINSQIAESSITQLLTSRHGTKDFFIINTDSIKQTIESTTGTMTLLISCIAFISLLVGGIGVMNIMLVSVTERTKEIGLRMAIGAKKINILQQFLIEAILICFIGGLLGIVLSSIIGFTFNTIVGSTGSMTMMFSVNSLVLAIVFSTIIGVLFGFMPARNAAQLNPIEALARE